MPAAELIRWRVVPVEPPADSPGKESTEQPEESFAEQPEKEFEPLTPNSREEGLSHNEEVNFELTRHLLGRGC